MVGGRHIQWATALFCAALFAVERGLAQEVPRQSWHDLAHYPARGLSPLYEETARACERILQGGDRWAVLPRPVSEAFLRPDQPPVFEMHNGDLYYNNLFGNAEAVRWAAEQSWDGRFRLLYNAKVRARHGDDFWFTIDGFQPPLKFVHQGEWTTYRPLGAASFSFTNHSLARASEESWWLASSSGLYRLEEGTLRREKIPGWPGGAAQGVVSGKNGRAVAWSEESTGRGAVVGFLEQGQWTSREVYRHDRWTSATMRSDGRAVLAGRSQVVMVEPPSAIGEDEERLGPERQEELEHLRRGRFAVGDDWTQPLGAVAMNPGGSVLFAARRIADNAPGLVRILDSEAPEWIDFAGAHRMQIAAMPDEGFLILRPDRGMSLLEAKSLEPTLAADANETTPGDRLLGCDYKGRAYLRRGGAILVFSSEGQSPSAVEPRELADLGGERYGQPEATDLRAAVDAEGAAWFVEPDGRVMILRPDDEEPVPADDRLLDGEALWPGRAGSMLIVRQEGRAAVGLGARKLVFGGSLLDLARDSFADVVAVAPCSSGDARIDLRHISASPRFVSRFTSPWLAVGESLWISDGKSVHRLRAGQEKNENGETVEIEEVCQGDFAMIGPLRSGALLLAKVEGRTPTQGGLSRINSWYWIEDPEGASKLHLVASPPRKQGEGTLERPETFASPWLLDGLGRLWLHQGFDRVYRIESLDRWPMLWHFGLPQFEHPAGVVWGYHSARVFAGYEIAGEADFRRSCRPTYLKHLTPVAGLGEGVLCLTPDGLARLRFDKDNPEKEAVVQSLRVRWNGAPFRYVGISGDRLLLIVQAESKNKLVSVSLQGLVE